MWHRSIANRLKSLKVPQCVGCNKVITLNYSQSLEKKYNEAEKEKILKTVNDSNADFLSRFEITKGRLKKLSQWKNSNGKVNKLTDIELIEGFNMKFATKLFDSIIEDKIETKESAAVNRIKGQILHPNMSENVRKNINTVVALYVTVNSVCWSLINRSNYEVKQWHYFSIDYPEGKKFQLTDILDIAWRVTEAVPQADVYVMKAEATTLRAAGSDPNNPKVISVNLQKAQMIAMIVALLNARNVRCKEENDEDSNAKFTQQIYFLRPTLPFRLYGTLVGSERVSTDQTIEMILSDPGTMEGDGSKVYIPEDLQAMFRSQNELQKDMLGHCLLLGLTFMDLCIYKNQARLSKLKL